MGTRAVIARITRKRTGEPSGFKGVYHHWDGYPSGLGKTLFKLYNGHFKKDLPAMLKFLTKDHGGWCTINESNFDLPAGYLNLDKRGRTDDSKNGPQCFCHGDRSEKGWTVNQRNASGAGCEWAYVFDKKTNTMQVFSSYRSDGKKMIGYAGCGDPDAEWIEIAKVDLNGDEPDWDAMKKINPLENKDNSLDNVKQV